MKKIILYAFLLSIIACNRQPKGFIIQGKVTGFEDSTMLYLQDADLQEDVDSIFIIDGKFSFKGKVDEPKRLYIHTKYEQGKEYKYNSLFVENKVIQLNASYNNFLYPKIIGSRNQDIENKLVDKIKSNDIKRDSLTQIYINNGNNLNDDQVNEIWKKIGVLDSLSDIERVKFIKENINSYPALEKLKWRMPEMNRDTLRLLFEQLTPFFKESKNGSLVNVYLNSRTVEIGKDFIDFEATTINGEPFKLSDIKKDFILLDFWSAGCGPCRMANEQMSNHYNELNENLEIVSFSVDIKKEWMQKASKEDGIIWTNVTDYEGTNSIVAIQYQISGIPCSYLINKDRKVIKKYLGYDPEFIDKLKTDIVK